MIHLINADVIDGLLVMRSSYKWHPQPSSIRKATAAAIRGDFRDKIVLDCFCGTGSHGVAALRAAARKYIGTDLENYSFCVRKEMRKYLGNHQNFGERTVFFEWGINATESIHEFDYDILFVDPPNPYQIVGAYNLSIPRDTNLNGGQLTKFWRSRFSDGNWIEKKKDTVDNVKSLFKTVISENKCIVANLFNTKSHNNFDYAKEMDSFCLTRLFETYYEVTS